MPLVYLCPGRYTIHHIPSGAGGGAEPGGGGGEGSTRTGPAVRTSKRCMGAVREERGAWVERSQGRGCAMSGPARLPLHLEI